MVYLADTVVIGPVALLRLGWALSGLKKLMLNLRNLS